MHLCDLVRPYDIEIPVMNGDHIINIIKHLFKVILYPFPFFIRHIPFIITKGLLNNSRDMKGKEKRLSN